MTATEAALGSRLARIVVGRGAVLYPRQAMLWAGTVLAVAVASLLLLTRPWTDGATAPSVSLATSAADTSKRLSRSAYGPDGVEVGLTWATPEYLRLTNQTAAAARFDPAHNLVFFQLEHKHSGDLGKPLRPMMRMQGMTMAPTQAVTTVDSSHHRFTVLVFGRMDTHMAHGGPIELVLPPARAGASPSTVSWPPTAAVAGAAGTQLQFTWATLLALFGGLLSSMWPCLFQLTVYFIPTLAGLAAVRPGAESATIEQASLARARVVKTASAFVLGFVIVYTAAGAAAGLASQSLGSTSIFWTIRRPLSIAAGIVILLMAVRLAANGRAPLVCKMPIGNFLGRRHVGYLGTMLLGLAFAIGCTTCFGAAVVLAMVTYVGVAASPLSGALIMLVFALGMAIPLLVGAAAMARVLSLLGRMERVAPYMILGAAVIMAGFAVLLISGHSMELSNLVATGAR